jgi:hypothetical protein
VTDDRLVNKDNLLLSDARFSSMRSKVRSPSSSLEKSVAAPTATDTSSEGLLVRSSTPDLASNCLRGLVTE